VPLKLNSPVEHIKGVGRRTAQVLARQGIGTVFDLLLHFPDYYIDFGQIDDTIGQEEKLYRVEVVNFRLSRNYKKRLSILRVKSRLAAQEVLLVFFNRPYLYDFFKENRQIYFFGKIEGRQGVLQTVNPRIFTDIEEMKAMPVYPGISTLKSGTIRKLVAAVFEDLADPYEPLPEPLLAKHAFPGITEALKHIHLPPACDEATVERLKKRFIYGEFLFFQLELQTLRRHFKRVPRLHAYQIDDQTLARVRQRLPFGLTDHQEQAFADIVDDLKSGYTMQRLLQGDVGSGKTVIALLALLLARESGFQGAFLVPTEILAHQHAHSAGGFFKPEEIDLLTGSTPPKRKAAIRRRLRNGDIRVIFGTHALLEEDIQFKHLALIVIDEQHRFGVSQRAALYYKGRAVDLLVTTATPIPRTLLLSIYNDLSVSLIRQKPAGRKPIKTKIIPPERRDAFYDWLKARIADGEKTYIILPLIERSEFFSQLRSLEADGEFFVQLFDPLPVGIVSGKSSAAEKEKMLARFASGEIRVLIATTVVEVGIDVKDATIMVIENGDRYGLAQLHQLRGRVGRGEAPSFCYLLPSPQVTDGGKQRLKTAAATGDGFKIAEMDLKMRGGGIIPGFRQSGYLDFKVGDVRRDQDVFEWARQDASDMLDDPARQNRQIADFLSSLRDKIGRINFS
jgi:ATP-dependent DNA helicase RecG